jgi:hypothetical protein
LFEADQRDLPFEVYVPSEPLPVAQPAEQLLLFEGKVPMVGEVERAVLDGDFRLAREAYDRLRITYPADAAVSFFRFLSHIRPDIWTASLGCDERLSAWKTLATLYATGSPLYRAVRHGFFRRLLQLDNARDLALSQPWVAADVANHLWSAREYHLERELVRDLLLAGNELPPLAFEDESVSDLLGEEGMPEWLAGLGAIRDLWPRPPPDGNGPERLRSPIPVDERAKALDFWFCLCVSGMGARLPEETRHDAHRRMKQLNPTLHEEFMPGHSVGRS